MSLGRDAHHAAMASLNQTAGGGEPTSQDIERVAAAVGRTPRTVRRWRQQGPPTYDRNLWQARDEDLAAFYECNGRYNAAWRRRHLEERTAGRPYPSRPTFYRAIKRATSSGDRAFARDGEAGLRARSQYARYEVACRNARWEIDACLLDCEVAHGRGRWRPWLVLILDSKTRAIMGWGIFAREGVRTDEALAVLHDAVLVDGFRGPFGGAPDVLACDNAREFLSTAMTDALTALGIAPDVCDPHSPHQKGKVQRIFKTIKDEFLAAWPRFGGGPRNAAGIRYQPSTPPSLTALQDGFGKWVDQYNRHRVHSTLAATPLQMWEREHTSLRTYEPGELSFLLAFRAVRTVQKYGIELEGRTYIAPALNGLVGEKIEIRRNPGEHGSITVLVDGEYICVAALRDPTDCEQAQPIAAKRNSDRKRADGLRRQATRRQAQQIAAMSKDAEHSDSPHDDVRVNELRPTRSRKNDRSLVRLLRDQRDSR